MDEPFNSLEAETRSDCQEFFDAVAQGTRQTVLFVTHDIDEAIRLGDRIVVLSGSPGAILYEVILPLAHPRSVDVKVSEYGINAKREVLAPCVRRLQRTECWC